MLNIKQNISLAPFTTFGIGGNAKFFIEVKNTKELVEAVKFKRDNRLSHFILGGGSNILISDKGFNGLVIKMNIRGLWINDLRSRLSTGMVLRCGAGEAWDDVVAKAVELGVGGIENLSLIPGTVGGAVYQNIGAYGVELKDVLVSVKVYDTKNDKIIELSNKECGFEYRSSVFKKNKDLIVLEAELLLSKNHKPDLSYPDLQKRFEDQNPSISEVRNTVIEIRKSKLVYPEEAGNAGSFFKNPVVQSAIYNTLHTTYPDLKGHILANGLIKLSAAQLIEKAGFKGKKFGNVGVSDKHALVLVNYGEGTASNIIELSENIKTGVYNKFGVRLEEEVLII